MASTRMVPLIRMVTERIADLAGASTPKEVEALIALNQAKRYLELARALLQVADVHGKLDTPE